MDGEKKMDKIYDIPVNFTAIAPTEEEAERNVMRFLTLASMDFFHTYKIKDWDLVEFIASESGNV